MLTLENQLTPEDQLIMIRFDWAPYDSEHAQPSYKNRICDRGIFSIVNMRDKRPLAYKSMRDYYATAEL